MRTQPFSSAERAYEQRLVRAMLGLNLASFLILYLSTRWDVAEHIKGAVDRFWYPPHYGIYFGLLMAALLSLAGLFVVFRGPGLPFEKLRQNPALTCIAVLNGFSFLGAPFDAWWHETFGLDLSVWSPPHIHLIVGIALVIMACTLYFLDDDAVNAPLQRLRGLSRQSAIQSFALVMLMLILMTLFIEYESMRNFRLPRFIEERPLWFYPLTWTALAIFPLMLYVGLTRRLGLITLGMAAYIIVRLLLLGVDRTLFDYRGTPFYPLILPALAIDLTLAALARRSSVPSWRSILVASLITTGVLALTTPLLWTYFGLNADLLVAPWLTYWPAILIVGALSGLAGWWSGSALRRLRPTDQQTSATRQPEAAFVA